MKETTEKVRIRRRSQDSAWRARDRKFTRFILECTTALLTEVNFIHKAKPMICPGYESTGEIVGIIRKFDTALQITMPLDTKRTAVIVYDPKMRHFHHRSDKKVTQADYVVLTTNGGIIAGWKT